MNHRSVALSEILSTLRY